MSLPSMIETPKRVRCSALARRSSRSRPDWPRRALSSCVRYATIGGAFGSGLRPQYQLFLAVMATFDLERSVRVTLTRDRMFTLGYRPYTWHEVRLGAKQDGTLQALMHNAVAGTSTYEDYQEMVVNWSGLLYHSTM